MRFLTPSYLLSRRTPGFDDLFVMRLPYWYRLLASSAASSDIRWSPTGMSLVAPYLTTRSGCSVRPYDHRGLSVRLPSSEYARRQLKARAYGSSIPSLRRNRVAAGVVLPRLDERQMKALGLRAFAVRTARHEAVTREREARSLVERWIEEQGAA